MYYIEMQSEAITGKGVCPDNSILNEGQIEVTEKEYNTVVFQKSIEQLREAKTAEIKQACNSEILGGFYSDIKGANELYGFEYEDQINIEALKNNVALGLIPDGTLTYYRSGGDCEPWSNAEFMGLYQTAMIFKTNRITTCKALIEQIKIATVEELELIEWVRLSGS